MFLQVYVHRVLNNDIMNDIAKHHKPMNAKFQILNN